jgi:lincosamide and streptogramin A transport system ATP-binding/permease protein
LIDSEWRAGLVGRNGRGKTTLMKLIARELTPDSGELIHSLTTQYFPFHPADPGATAFTIVKNAVAPFDTWERRLETLLAAGTDQALAEYAECLTQYDGHGGYTIDARAGAGARSARRRRRQTQPSVPVFVGRRADARVDCEPVRHGRLLSVDRRTDESPRSRGPRNRRGLSCRATRILVVSHDRAFLDSCIDHVIAIQREDAVVHATTYSEWLKLEREQPGQLCTSYAFADAFAGRTLKCWDRNGAASRNTPPAIPLRMAKVCDKEAAPFRPNPKGCRLKRDIRALSRASAQRREGALARERDKAPHVDKGYVGHRAAKQMKRALAIERRIERQIDERKSLLRNAEKSRTLKLDLRFTRRPRLDRRQQSDRAA